MLDNKCKQIILGNTNVLRQGIELIEKVSHDDYVRIMMPQFQSCFGQHIRHIVDAYLSVQTAQLNTKAHVNDTSFINYESRSRGSTIESSQRSAISNIRDVLVWLSGLSAEDMTKKYQAVHQVTTEDEGTIVSETNLERELIFLISHAIHHFALVRTMLMFMNYELSAELGKANGTLSHENECREEKAAIDANAVS